MKALFNFIKAAILARIVGEEVPTPKPKFKTVEMWRGQTTRERLEKKQNPFRLPAVFIEFIVEDVQNFSLGIKNVTVRVRFRFAFQSMKFERLEDLDFQDLFDKHIQGLRGNPADTVQFSSLQEVVTDLDEDFDNVNEPFVDYMTIWRKTSAYKRADDILVNPVALNASGEQL